MKEEFDTLRKAHTWAECDKVPEDAEVIPSGMILRLKRDEDGKPARFEARLVARGNLQNDDALSFSDLYAPVACIELVRLLLTISVAFGWTRHHLDIKGAFLYATLPESTKICLKLPFIKGVEEANGRIVRLRKSLYELRQAPQLWYQLLAKALQTVGFTRLPSTECLFALRTKQGYVLLLAYVDDLLLVGREKLVVQVKKRLSGLFKVTDLGRCTFFLGIKMQETAKGIFLSQPAYISKIIRDANMTTEKATRAPLSMGHPLYEELKELGAEESSAMALIPFRENYGEVLYLCTHTRPNIAIAVSMLCKFFWQVPDYSTGNC